MRLRPWLFVPLAALGLGAALVPAADPPTPPEVPANDTGVTWKKTVLDTAFRSEGVTVADVNKDGKLDVVNGEVWYEAPDWKMHEIRPSKNYRDGDKNIYSQSFACWAEDLNGDGWVDVIVVGFPGAPCYWYENPKGAAGHWKQHEIWHSACNETPQYVDLFGTGKRVLLMGWQPKGKDNEGQMAWFAPGDDPTKPWVMHAVSEPPAPGKAIPGTQRFAHGLGVGDVNGDGRLDVLVPQGWWEQPAKGDLDKPWQWHPVNLGDACADMYACDLDGDGKADILSSSAHGYGIWAHMQKPGKPDPAFVKQTLFPKFVSQTHALVLADIDGDGLPDFVTGKRHWAHGPTGDADPNAAAMLYWFQAKKKDGITTFVPRVIDNDSGVGTQFYVGDVNGDKLLDVVVSNKKGTFLFEQVRAKK